MSLKRTMHRRNRRWEKMGKGAGRPSSKHYRLPHANYCSLLHGPGKWTGG